MSISNQQKLLIRHRAANCCEYCRLGEGGRLARFHIDHIIAIKHDGTDTDDNLCLACPKCNAHKGENIAAADPETAKATFLFHPRRQVWKEHFSINADATISGLTPEGRATVAVLRINDDKRVKQRYGDMAVGDYPCKKDE
ncbi:MAG: HNH endonuclease [Anaerolineaceae bacterium]|nr:MAG: HNH endonuclease [Anaerolineaceae bacterium]